MLAPIAGLRLIALTQILGTLDNQRIAGQDACQHGNIGSAVEAELTARRSTFPSRIRKTKEVFESERTAPSE